MSRDDLAAYRTAPTWPARVDGRADGRPRDVGRGRRGRRPGALRGDPDPGPPDRRRRQHAAVHRRHLGARPTCSVTDGSWSSPAPGTLPTTPTPSGSSPRSARSSRADYHSPMTDSDAATPTAAPSGAERTPRRTSRPYSPGLEGVVGAESAIGLVDGKNGRLLYRGYPIGQLVESRHVRRGRRPALDRRVAPRRRVPPGARPGAGPRGPPRAAPGRRPPDGRPADRGLGLGGDPEDRLAADARAGAGRDRVLAVGAGRVRPDPPRPRAGRAGPDASTWPAASSSSSPGRPRTRRRRAPSTPTSSSAPSTASTRRRSRPG